MEQRPFKYLHILGSVLTVLSLTSFLFLENVKYQSLPKNNAYKVVAFEVLDRRYNTCHVHENPRRVGKGRI